MLGTPRGALDLRTGQLLAPAPSLLISRVTGYAPEQGPALRWMKFLDEATGGDDELIGFLQRFAGYALTGQVVDHVLLFIHGPGGNGKTVYTNVLVRVLGDYAQTAQAATFAATRHHDRHPTEIAAMDGARLVIASETEQGATWAEAKIKELTGGAHRIRARFMRQDEFEFHPQFKVLIVGNHRPRLREVDDAMRRRLRLVEFNRRPDVPDPHLEATLLREGGQILAWAIDGCLEWQRDGLRVPPSVAESTEAYLAEQDVFGDWFATRLELRGGAFEPAAALFRSWEQFARRGSEEPGSTVQFAERLQKRGLKNRRTAIGKVWDGVRLVTLTDE
jgi:putative DNA primase/helicase